MNGIATQSLKGEEVRFGAALIQLRSLLILLSRDDEIQEKDEW
jgi:hypothetical protein